MDRLPVEILVHIISHLAAVSHESNWVHSDGSWINIDGMLGAAALALYATVSRQWQEPVEARTFAQIVLTPERLASPLAAQVLTPDRIRRFVRSVQVHVMLPTYDEEARGRREDDADIAANDAAFTDIVRKVFAFLSSSVDTTTMTEYRPKIRLFMEARCISDTKDWEARQWEYDVGHEPNDIFEARYESSYLDLERSTWDKTDTLPELCCISEFQVQAITGLAIRHFAPRALCLMASKMAGLETIHWSLHDHHNRKEVERRKKLRADFADRLQTLPSTLRCFGLTYWCNEPNDYSFESPSLLDVADQSNSDQLSLALHKLSQGLTHFSLNAEVGPEILWPPGSNNTFSPPLWPSMVRYSICPGAIAPSGKWRFRRRADASDSDEPDNGTDSDIETDLDGGREHYFRDEPEPYEVPPLLLAAARAAGRMPALRSLAFTLNSPMNRGGVEVGYRVARGGRPTLEGTMPGMAELFVESASTFLPGEEVMQAWGDAARGHTGTETGLAVVISRVSNM